MTKIHSNPLERSIPSNTVDVFSKGSPSVDGIGASIDSPVLSKCPFNRLGLYGLDNVAPILIAALVSEEPLLLIGPHGTAKSLLLTRIAEALHLPFRHYNASLLNFDDLVGFPHPGKDGTLDYIKTPASIWGAGAVIFDEISRCRPDIQNKLFPIIHEKRVQGLPLSGLRYRWSAMNPPSTEQDENGYLGSEPLDAALADRFAFVLTMPCWTSLSEQEQLAVIKADTNPVQDRDALYLQKIVSRAATLLPLFRQSMGEEVAVYIRTLQALLAQAGIHLSPRRAGMLFRSTLCVHAAAIALDPSAQASDSAMLAVRNGLPSRAQGIPVQEAKLLAAHREAWRLANVSPQDPLRAILTTIDPIERLRLAIACTDLGKSDFSSVVADAFATLRPGQRDAAAVHLFETGSIGRLNAAIAEDVANRYQSVVTPLQFSEALHATSPRFKTWSEIKNLLSRLNPEDPRAHLQANAIAACFSRKEIATPEDAETVFNCFAETETALRGVAA